MVARALRLGARAAGTCALALFAACTSEPAAPHGAPVLTSVYWIAGDSTSLVWTRDPQTALPPSAPPFVSEVDFVFDRRLDGSNIEDTITVDGEVTTRPTNVPPVDVTWPEMTSTQTAFGYTVRYNSLGRFGSGTSYVFLRPDVAGVPSGETVTFELVAARFTSAYGEPLASPTPVSVLTTALALSVSGPSAAVGGTYQLPLAFSNRMPAASGMSELIQVRAGGVEVPYALVSDANLASRWYVTPADCLGRWPASTTFTVVVKPGLLDAFGGKLAAGASTTFSTSVGGATTPDCGVTGDGAAPGGDTAADAEAADAGTADAEAADAMMDVPTDAADAATDVLPGAADAGAADAGAADAGAADAGAADAGAADAGAADAGAADATAPS
jgi:hypothetical protein